MASNLDEYRDKNLFKQNSSFNTSEKCLTTTGIRGRKTFAFWTLVCLLFILAVGNLLLTGIILGVLRLGHGMQSLEILPDDAAVKFFGDTDLNHIYKRDGRFESFKDYPMDITGDDAGIILQFASDKSSEAYKRLVMDHNGITLNISEFEVKTDKKENVFSTNESKFNITKPIRNLKTNQTITKRIISPKHSNLHIEGKTVNFTGAEGTTMAGKEILLFSDQDIHFLSRNGTVVLDGFAGVYLNTKKIPTFTPGKNITMQYKLCICMPQGKLFKIPVTKDNTHAYCDRINISQFNPCI